MLCLSLPYLRSSYLKVGSDINPREFYQVSQSLLVLLFSTGMHYPLTSPTPIFSSVAEDENLGYMNQTVLPAEVH